MEITINGKPCDVDLQSTIVDLLVNLNLQGQRIAVEVNQEVITRSEHCNFKLSEGDRVEIIQAVGGG